MQLKQLLKDISVEKIIGDKDISIKGISSHSAEVKQGYMFVALRGKSRDGHDFVSEVTKKGAVAVVIDKNFKLPLNLPAKSWQAGGITYIYVQDTQEALAKIADNYYGNPTNHMKIIGITGTNGKTTVSYLIDNILKSHGLVTGRIGTIDYCWGGRVIPSSHTTPPPIFLNEIFNKMRTDKVKTVVMEVSSHSLVQKRVDTVQFDSCIFTNIQRDHLDYHSTVSDYISSKRRLIDLLYSSSKQNKFLIINGDDEVLKSFPISNLPCIFYGFNKTNNVYASEIEFNWNRTTFNLNSPWHKGKVEVPLVGNFNLYNVLAAISFAGMDGLNITTVIESLKNIKQVTGRFQVFKKDAITTIVDYAHTPDALEKVIETARKLTNGKLITIFGCGGNRDKGKRPIMGEISSKKSDYTIITSDNPRSEDPLEIIKDIKKGVSGSNWCVEADRAKAIEQGINMLNKGDVLLVAGKGHESCQILKDTVIPFSDIEIVKRHLISNDSKPR
ncbi:UDP-N-acetylmuramoyl-L-alanyl-D-glutamate--2,6-diaminopimelate ligase [bacterium]|nr:UDP-N-acetylmuramoyl-L-alanyl-D-glutamate--2,6-diaminopimelate ligase [bacterium]